MRGELLKPYLLINVNGLVQPTESGSVWEKFELHLTSNCLLELLATEYLRETISFYISFMVICSLDALKKFSKLKEVRIKMETIAWHKAHCKKRWGDEILGFDLRFVMARITLTLILSFAIIGSFQRVNFQRFNLCIKIWLTICILVWVMWVIWKIGCFMWK